MLSKGRERLLRRLKTRKGRPREGLVLVEGLRSVAEALAADVDVRFALRSEGLLTSQRGRMVVQAMTERGVDQEDVDDMTVEALSDTEQPQGVLLVCEEPRAELSDWTERTPQVLLLLDGIQDPGNLGTLVRAARAFGVDGVVVLDGSVDPWNPKAVRAAAGAGFHVGLVRAPWAEVGPWMEARGIEILAGDPAGGDVDDWEPTRPWALAVGNEGSGLRPELVAAARCTIAIRMSAGVDSLNAGVAGSILLHILTRQGRSAS